MFPNGFSEHTNLAKKAGAVRVKEHSYLVDI